MVSTKEAFTLLCFSSLGSRMQDNIALLNLCSRPIYESSRYSPKRFQFLSSRRFVEKHGAPRHGVRFFVGVLTGIPTIIFGLFAWVIIVIPQQTFSGLAGGVDLGIIVIPIVASTSEEVLRLVPRELREASLALDATETRTILRIVIPSTLNGILTGIVLAMARVAGETAPLLMTAFGTPFFNTDIMQPMDVLPLRIFNFTESPYHIQINQAHAGALVLILLILITSFSVRWATGGFKQRG
jgi:phosphate transport system permease protein